MLRDVSTRIGTTASRALAGGSIATGRKRNRTSAASTATRSATRTPRCARVSGASGRRYSSHDATPIAAASRSATYQESGWARCMNSLQSAVTDSRQSAVADSLQSAVADSLQSSAETADLLNPHSADCSRSFLPGDGLEVAVHLLFVSSRRFVVGTRRETFLGLLRLQLLRDRRLHVLERLRRVAAHLFPLGKILLEGFGAWRGQRHGVGRFEREPAAGAARVARVVAAHLLHEVLRFLELTSVLIAQLLQVRAGAAAATLLPLSGASRAAGGFLRALCLTRPTCLAGATCPTRLTGLRELLCRRVQLIAQLLRARALIGELLRFPVLCA